MWRTRLRTEPQLLIGRAEFSGGSMWRDGLFQRDRIPAEYGIQHADACAIAGYTAAINLFNCED